MSHFVCTNYYKKLLLYCRYSYMSFCQQTVGTPNPLQPFSGLTFLKVRITSMETSLFMDRAVLLIKTEALGPPQGLQQSINHFLRSNCQHAVPQDSNGSRHCTLHIYIYRTKMMMIDVLRPLLCRRLAKWSKTKQSSDVPTPIFEHGWQ